MDPFLESLINFDKENIAEPTLKAIRPYLSNQDFDPNSIRNKSTAAAGKYHAPYSFLKNLHNKSGILIIISLSGLCSWVINIIGFFDVYCDVEPKRKALQAANDELASAQDKFAKIQAKIKVRLVFPPPSFLSTIFMLFPCQDLDDNLAALTRSFEEATEAKLRSQQEAESTADTITLANRYSNTSGGQLHGSFLNEINIDFK